MSYQTPSAEALKDYLRTRHEAARVIEQQCETLSKDCNVLQENTQKISRLLDEYQFQRDNQRDTWQEEMSIAQSKLRSLVDK